nr:hypothetical protein [Tanacetum cinerariifolium]
CKVMRTPASVEIEIVLILGLPCCLSSSSVRCLESVAAMSDSAFHKRFRTSYDSSLSPTFLVRKRCRGTSELIFDIDSEEDEEIKENSDSDSVSEDAEDEGPTIEDE